MPYALNGSVKIEFETSGQGEPLLLVMGLGADRHLWREHEEVYRKYFQCIAIDNRGVGGSDKPPGPYSTTDMAADVRAVMDHLGIKRAHIAGISMGGAIAQEFCLQNPARARSMVLISTFAKLPRFHATVFEHFKSVRAHTSTDDFMRCLQLWIWGEKQFETRHEALLQAQCDAVGNPAPQPQYAFEAQCDACIHHDTLDRLSTLTLPTLVTAGDRDIFTPLALSEEIHRRVEGAELVAFENCAHTHHWEDVERFNAVTLDFLLRHRN